MKLKLLLSFAIGATLTSNAQNSELRVSSSQKNNSQFINHTQANQAERGGAIWTNDFSNPADWVSTNVNGNTGNWVFGTDAPSGPFAIPAIESTTAANGFALLDSDVICNFNLVVNLTTANSIDLSDQPYVSLEFEQFYERFFDSTFVFISNDNVTWTKFVVNSTLVNNQFVPNNPTTTNINITSVAGSQETVWIRFQYFSPSSLGANAGCGYAWMIDDVRLVVPPQFDLEVLKVYHANIENDLQFTSIPPAQAVELELGAIIKNLGWDQNTFNVNYDIKRNGTSVNSGQFPAFQAASNEEITLWRQTGFTPTELGDYTVEFTVVSTSGEDATPANNARQSAFKLDPFIMSAVGPINTTINWGGTAAPYTIHELGNAFIINSDVVLTAVNVAFGPTTTGSSSSVVREAKISIYELGQSITSIGEATFYPIKSTDVNAGNGSNYAVVVLENEIPLLAGTAYIVTVGNADDQVRVIFQGSIGDDDDGVWLYGPFGAGGGAPQWFGAGNKPAINLNFDPNIASVPNVNDEVSVINLFPNPSNDIARVSLMLEKNTNVIINLIDINGRVISTENLRERNGVVIHQLNTQNLASGIYNVQVITNNNIANRKLIIAK